MLFEFGNLQIFLRDGDSQILVIYTVDTLTVRMDDVLDRVSKERQSTSL